jgi:hypothetical protein
MQVSKSMRKKRGKGIEPLSGGGSNVGQPSNAECGMGTDQCTNPSPAAQLICQNTDRELWREREGDYYADSIHVTDGGGIGIDCGGFVIVKPLRKWHELAKKELSGGEASGLYPPKDNESPPLNSLRLWSEQ